MVDAKIGKRVGDFLRSFAGMIRTWMLRNGLGAKTMTVDDFVGYAMAGLDRAVAGEVRGRANAQASIGARARSPKPSAAGLGDSKVVDENGRPAGGVSRNKVRHRAVRQRKSRTNGAFSSRLTRTLLVLLPTGLALEGGKRWRQRHAGIPQHFKPKESRGPWHESDVEAGAIEAAMNEGHDGIHVTNGDYWIAFRPNQIKSAVGNNGDFDPNNDNILFSRSVGDAPAQEAQRVQSAIEGKTLIEAAQFLRARTTARRRPLRKGAGEVAAPGESRRGARPEDCPPRRHGPGEHGECARLHGDRIRREGPRHCVWLNGADVTGQGRHRRRGLAA